jgi:hypothetical protein
MTLNLERHLRPRYRGNEWTKAVIKSLGTISDKEAARTGRIANAVRIKRERAGVKNPTDKRRQRNDSSNQNCLHHADVSAAHRRHRWFIPRSHSTDGSVAPS